MVPNSSESVSVPSVVVVVVVVVSLFLLSAGILEGRSGKLRRAKRPVREIVGEARNAELRV